MVYHESGSRSVEIDCPACGDVHRHEWPIGELIIGYRAMKCTVSRLRGQIGGYEIEIPDWAFDRRQRTGYAKRPVRVSRLSDNAFYDPANKWEE